MALTITDTRVTLNEADNTTGWVSNEGLTVFTTDPDPVEATGCLGAAVSTETSYVSASQAATNITNTLCYVWVLANGTMDTVANGGIALVLSDGTNRIGFHLAGSDRAAFRHATGPVGWQCLLLDTSQLPTAFTVLAGTRANLNLTAITQIGAQYKTLSKALGGGSNCFTDVVRRGNGGLILTAGTVGSPGTFDDIAAADRSTLNLTAYGIVRELGAGLFGCQGRLTFGSTTNGVVSYFQESNTTLVFENRNLATDKYSIVVQGNTTANTTFILGTRGGEGLGSQGVTLAAGIGVAAAFNASDVNIQNLGIYGCNFNGISQGVTFSSSTTNAPNHEIFATTFAACGAVTVGLTEFRNNTIANSIAPSATILSSTVNVSDLSFVSSGTGHAITITAPGTYDFTNFTYEGYAATNGTTGNEVFYNNSGGAITVNVSGGNTPTVRNSAGSTTTIVSTVSITLTGMKENTEIRVYEAGTSTEIAGIEIATAGTVDNRTFTFSATPDQLVDIITFNLNWISDPLRNFSIPSANSNIPIAQRVDRVYFNPV